METIVKRLYEAMFLVDSAQATDWDATIAAIKNILERVEAEIVVLRKWDERRLAYEIKGKSRGTYILCYFRADGNKIQDVEKAVQLSERIMRVLILSAETRGQRDLEEDLSVQQEPEAAAPKEPVAEQAEERKQRAAEEAAQEAEMTETHAEREDETVATEASAEREPPQAEEPQESAEPAADEAELEQAKDTEYHELSDEQAKKEATED